jgi:hypothetical protein
MLLTEGLAPPAATAACDRGLAGADERIGGCALDWAEGLHYDGKAVQYLSPSRPRF